MVGKGYHSRREGIRKPKRTVIIVCEGKETETTYFKGFRTRNNGVRIHPIYGGCTDPKSIVAFAEERMCKWDLDFDKGDGLWCVFDVDENTEQTLRDTFDHAKTSNIQIALSNPCFELWFLLHYKQITSSITRQEALSELKRFIKNYEKNKNINPLLKDKLSTAIINAKRLNAMHNRSGTSLTSRESNPSTQVFKLVEFIQKLVES